MKPKTALTIILILSILGLLFSAYFAYYDTWGSGCKETIVACPEGNIISDVPICLYGVVINLLVIVFSLLGLLGKGKKDEEDDEPQVMGPKKKDLEIKEGASTPEPPKPADMPSEPPKREKGPMEDVKM